MNKKLMNQSSVAALMVLGLLSSNLANAHAVQGGGLINGMMHPVFGVDHLLAMVAVGVLSIQMGG